MRDVSDAEELAELLDVVGDVVLHVLEDRTAAMAEGREAISLWEMLGDNPHALAVGERMLELALRQLALRQLALRRIGTIEGTR